MKDLQIANKVRIISVVSTTSATPLKTLIQTRLTALSKTMPSGNIVQIAITPNANLALSDPEIGDTITLASGTRLVIPSLSVLDDLILKNTATVAVELYFG